MIQSKATTDASAQPLNGEVGLESRLRRIFGEQQRLRELLERTRAELDEVNAELFRFQDEYCTDAARQAEYEDALEQVLGFNPRIDLKEVEEILAGKRSCDMGEFIEELERTLQATPSQGAS
jgi:hypothetical protein